MYQDEATGTNVESSSGTTVEECREKEP
ncbi:hypothetical protein A2U01_0042468 [Trifolium medium]|uniref:Uncharacterized protein n=1 Tax=Trifolium medium TaxID=97028 RepID=A0A392QBP5_9FABA|nr:hypothetical protein [Trifolium medium]